MAGAPDTHPFFACDTGQTVMSHHGTRGKHAPDGSLQAYLTAYGLGYRWFQVDVVPYRDGLVCMHAVFGRRRGFSRMSLEQVRARAGRDVATLQDVLDHPGLAHARWNVEVKTSTARRQLAAALHNDGTVRPVLVSAPFHPALLRDLDDRFGDLVALAAPIRHGGALGVRLGQPHEPYTAVQVHRLVARRVVGSRWGRTLAVQVWGLGREHEVDAALDLGAHPIVNGTTSELAAHLRAAGRFPKTPEEAPTPPRVEPSPPTPPPDPGGVPDDRRTPIRNVCLGGGGWRGAFGSIGAVMYLHVTGRWADVQRVVAVSGGSFVTSALAAAGAEADTDPVPAATAVLGGLIGLRGSLRRRFLAAALPAPLLVVPPLFALVERLWLQRLMRGLLRRLFGDRTSSPEGGRQYVVCATGRSSARPYFFVSRRREGNGVVGFGQVLEVRRDRGPAVEIDGTWRLTDAVQSATSLPGIDGYRCPDRAPTSGDDGRGEVLIDGGVQGIFGLQFTEPDSATSLGDDVRTLIIDAGREERRSSPLMERVTSLSTIALLARWVQLALDTGFRNQVKRAQGSPLDGSEVRFRWVHLVRIAERDRDDPEPSGYPFDEISRRIACGRRKVHRFGLTGLSAANAHLTMVVAIAACAYELGDADRAPATVESVDVMLLDIGQLLGRGDALAKVWRDL